MRLNIIDWIALVILIIGGINWGLIGLIDFNLISAVFGDYSIITKIVYLIIGISGLYLAFVAGTRTTE